MILKKIIPQLKKLKIYLKFNKYYDKNNIKIKKIILYIYTIKIIFIS